MTKRLLEAWDMAAQELGLKVTTPYELVLPSGVSIKALLHVKDFGNDKGMLIFTDYKDIKNYVSELIDEGFGCSILSEPRENEPFSMQNFIELLEDWGWSGVEKDRPTWLVSD